MLHDKDIKNLSELKTTFVAEQKKKEIFSDLVDSLKLGKHHAIFSNVKQKGIPVIILIKILLSFAFIGEDTVYSFTRSYWNKFANFGKDAYYRLKRNSKINWRKFLLAVITRTLKTLSGRATEENTKNIKAFIIDDTTIQKTGVAIEGVSRVWNHVIRKSILGFQLLVMGYYDGTMFMPVDFSFHREKGKNKKYKFGLTSKENRKQFSKKRDKTTPAYTRKKELDISKIASAIKMIIRGVKNSISADYVIVDSWFTCWKLVKTAIENNLQFMGMFSKTKTKFTYLNQQMTYKTIRQLKNNKVKRSRRFNLYYIRVVVKWHGQPIVLYFVRHGKRGKWKTILTTDLSLSFNETIEIYQLRWTIEVFFKESKQLLNLGKSQSNDFDAQIADTTIIMIQYIFLALRHRIDKYESIGGIYKNTKAEILETVLHKRLIQLLIAIIEEIKKIFEQTDIDELFVKMINDEQIFEKIKALIKSSDNTDLEKYS